MSGNIEFGTEDTVNPFAAEKDERHRGRDPRARKVIALGIICAVIFLIVLLVPSPFQEGGFVKEGLLASWISQFTYNCQQLIATFTGAYTWTWETYFCTYVVVAVAGAAMSLCGSVYQSTFHNPLAAPKTLGVMSGASVGILIFALFFMSVGPQFAYDGWSYTYKDYMNWFYSLSLLDQLWLQYGKALFSVLGSFLVVGVVVFLAALCGRGRLSNITLIIGGTVFSVGITSLIQFFRYNFSLMNNAGMADVLMSIENITFGNTYQYGDLLVICLPIVLCMGIVLLMRNRLTLLSFGDDEARSMGLATNRTRYLMIIVCTFMVGWDVSFCGHVAFLGFITAHLARKMVGPEIRYLLPASMFVGASFLLVIHRLTTMNIFFIPLYSDGMWTAIIGATFFLVMVARQRKETRGDWV